MNRCRTSRRCETREEAKKGYDREEELWKGKSKLKEEKDVKEIAAGTRRNPGRCIAIIKRFKGVEKKVEG